MKPESKIVAAYNYYKALYGDAVIMFRVKDFYQMFLRDALWAAPLLQLNLASESQIATLIFPCERYMDYVAILSACGKEVHAIHYRNDAGEFDIPDVERLHQERASDY